MKVNIITFYWSNNFGALIQAVSLRKFVENKFNFTVNFNSYLPKKLIIRERMSQINRKNLPKIYQLIKKKIILYNWKKKILNCDNPNQKIDLYRDDLYIYGSDEIWNYQNPFFDYDPYFFGKNNEKIKISYATSVGNAKFLKEEKIQNIKNYLNTFDDISVRDNATFDFVKKCTGKKSSIVLDPCFLVDLNSTFKNKYINTHEHKYILIYGDYFNKKQISDIFSYSRKNNLKIVSAGFYNEWADESIVSIDPIDLIYLFINSTLIYTSMFHGVMLSYKYKKQFWISEDPYRKNKLSYFINYLGLNDRYMENLNNHVLNYNLNRDKFNDWLDLSKNFLIRNIK